ncbi:unnamed protein product [Rhizoctonia solani]|uniref:Uncharacterized protein n=1 Tax=Rhizoctonia solani TaxID=456999 RepID=A0A8H3CJZ9_9AGAM|nr:unnamed protein product [Rhizoctonia solani]
MGDPAPIKSQAERAASLAHAAECLARAAAKLSEAARAMSTVAGALSQGNAAKTSTGSQSEAKPAPSDRPDTVPASQITAPEDDGVGLPQPHRLLLDDEVDVLLMLCSLVYDRPKVVCYFACSAHSLKLYKSLIDGIAQTNAIVPNPSNKSSIASCYKKFLRETRSIILLSEDDIPTDPAKDVSDYTVIHVGWPVSKNQCDTGGFRASADILRPLFGERLSELSFEMKEEAYLDWIHSHSRQGSRSVASWTPSTLASRANRFILGPLAYRSPGALAKGYTRQTPLVELLPEVSAEFVTQHELQPAVDEGLLRVEADVEVHDVHEPGSNSASRWSAEDTRPHSMREAAPRHPQTAVEGHGNENRANAFIPPHRANAPPEPPRSFELATGQTYFALEEEFDAIPLICFLTTKFKKTVIFLDGAMLQRYRDLFRQLMRLQVLMIKPGGPAKTMEEVSLRFVASESPVTLLIEHTINEIPFMLRHYTIGCWMYWGHDSQIHIDALTKAVATLAAAARATAEAFSQDLEVSRSPSPEESHGINLGRGSDLVSEIEFGEKPESDIRQDIDLDDGGEWFTAVPVGDDSNHASTPMNTDTGEQDSGSLGPINSPYRLLVDSEADVLLFTYVQLMEKVTEAPIYALNSSTSLQQNSNFLNFLNSSGSVLLIPESLSPQFKIEGDNSWVIHVGWPVSEAQYTTQRRNHRAHNNVVVACSGDQTLYPSGNKIVELTEPWPKDGPSFRASVSILRSLYEVILSEIPLDTKSPIYMDYIQFHGVHGPRHIESWTPSVLVQRANDYLMKVWLWSGEHTGGDVIPLPEVSPGFITQNNLQSAVEAGIIQVEADLDETEPTPSLAQGAPITQEEIPYGTSVSGEPPFSHTLTNPRPESVLTRPEFEPTTGLTFFPYVEEFDIIPLICFIGGKYNKVICFLEGQGALRTYHDLVSV